MNPPGDEARAKIQRLLVTGDNRLQAGRRGREGARELRAGARRSRARPGSRTRCGRSSRSGSPISNGSLENLLHPSRLQPDVVLLGRGSRGLVRNRQRRRASRSASVSAVSSSGSTSTPASGGTNSGGPPTRVATTLRIGGKTSPRTSNTTLMVRSWRERLAILAHQQAAPIPGGVALCPSQSW